MLRRSAFFAVSILALFLGFNFALAAEDCSKLPGTRPATADDAIVKNGQLEVGRCYNPSDPGVTQTAEEAKAYLVTLGTDRKCKTASPDAIRKLNDAFAVCAARFFKEYQQRYGKVYITSAYRSPGAGGTNQCAGGVDGSNHTRGVAIDVHPNSGNYDSMMNFAIANKQFGVCFPRPLYKGKPDLPHMILAGIGGGEGGRCANQGITKPCDGVNFDPNSVQAAAASSPTPSAQFANSIRSALGQPTLPPQPPLPQQTFAQMQPISNAFNQPTSSVTPTTGSEAIGGVSGQITSSTSTGTSSADILEDLAFGKKASTQGATSTFAVVINGSDVGGIGSGQKPPTSSSTSTSLAGASPIQNTFVTTDLSFRATNSFGGEQNSFAQILASIRATLLQMLQYLRPFGGPHNIEMGE